MHTSESVVRLSNEELAEQLDLLRKEDDRRESVKFVEFVRETLADAEMVEEFHEAGGTPVKVVWPTWDWDNGWFFNPYSGLVKLDNGEVVELDLGADEKFEELLSNQSALSQPLGARAELILDLLTDELGTDTYGD